MPSLKRTKEPETYELGQAVTTIISKTKELHKTADNLIDQIKYLESRKKTEEQSLGRIVQEKNDVLKLKQEVTDKIIAIKSEFTQEIDTKKKELDAKATDLAQKEADLSARIQESEKTISETKNELQHRLNELKKLNDDLSAREKTVAQATQRNIDDKASLIELRNLVESQKEEQVKQGEALGNKAKELDAREAQIVAREQELSTQSAKLSQTATEIEGQISLIESERNKNTKDMDAIRTMQKTLSDRKAELDNREIHINDREATAKTH